MLIWDLDSDPAIPTTRNEAPVACPPWMYTNRNLVEVEGVARRRNPL
jgi:hypothetical protein